MTHSLARPLRVERGRTAVASPVISRPASPYENFIADKDRIYQQLLTAGIDDDMAIETAIHVAMERTTAALKPDDYEFCNQVYGDKP